MTILRTFAACVGAVLAASALAPPHDTWLLVLPTDAEDLHAGAELSLRTGMDFPVSTGAVATERFSAVLRRPDGTTRPVEGWRADDADKVTRAALGTLKPGLHVAAVAIRPRLIELDAQSFNSYLLSDGMPQVLAGRIARDELYDDAVERYRKCPKVVFAVGDDDAGDFSTPLGQDLEIIPLEHPLRVRARGTLPVRVLFQGEPLVRSNLCWDRSGNGHDFTGSAWTDEQGEALVPIEGSGWMTLRLTHMTRPKAEDYEWESFWASLSFAVPE